jgi:FecR protein
VNTKEWLAAIGALSMSLNAAEAQQPGTDGRAGITSAVNTNTSGLIAGATRTLFIGNDVFKQERVTTDGGGRAQLLFLDQSAITIGPNADLVIDRFVYDEKSRLGTLAVQASRGLMRFVGGDISKQQDVLIRTPTSLIGIRGGISLIQVDQNGGTQAVFMFGTSMTVSSNQGGQTQLVTRPGFAVTVTPGQPPSSPVRISGATISTMLSQLEAPPPPPGTQSPVGPGPGRPDLIAPDRTLERMRDAYLTIDEAKTLSHDQDSNQLVMRRVISQSVRS